MAEQKKQEKETPEVHLRKEAEKDRAKVLEGAEPGEVVSRRAVEATDEEMMAADHFVNSEKTTPAERATYGHRVVVTNHTPAGLPSDVHQALVASSQLRRNEAMAFRDIQALVLKYRSADMVDSIPSDVLAHLEEEMSELEAAAKFDENARTLLEKYV